MARIGLNNFRYAKATVDSATGAITYGTVKKPAKAISFSFEPTVSDAKLYADDALAETDTTVTGGTVTMGIDKADLEVMADMLGHTYSNSEIVDNSNDVAPYVGVGRVTELLENNVKKYRATVIALVKFKEPSEDEQTRGESVEFGTYELEGDMVVPVSGAWRKRKTFESKDSAISYIEACLTGVASL